MDKVKSIFGNIWKWIKKNWVLVLVVLGLSFLAWSFKSKDQSYKDLFKNYTQQNADNQQQIEVLRNLQEQERVERERLLTNYLDELHRIEREYKAELGKIAEQRDTTQDNIISNGNTNPTSLTDAVTETFGIPVE